ncbi:MAG: PQQ-dependent sugar dehydrogenase [Halioglobus sp.]
MRKFFLIIAVIVSLPFIAYGAARASGVISSSSLSMILNVAMGRAGPAADAAKIKQRYKLPPGFSLQLYATDLAKVRFLHVTEAGDILASRTHAGEIILLRKDDNGDGVHDGMEILLTGLSRPLGLDVHDGWLYIGESKSVGRVRFNVSEGKLSGDYQPIIENLTDNGNHYSKTVRIGSDNKLYLAQGSTCNVCEEVDERRATMMRFNTDGSGGEIIATGLRNSVGFDWAPWNNALYATDNGRDLMGDDYPPCELNHIVEGNFYGWPYFNGNNRADPDMSADPLAASRSPTAPAHEFRAHNAPLGISFVNATGWPQDYQRSALAALHGSWNRSIPDGYKVVSLHWTETGIEERDFLTGFNHEGDISGRPVDVAQGPDGAVYISDDYAGAIYKVVYTGDANAAVELTAATVNDAVIGEASWLADADIAALTETGKALYDDNNCAECHEGGEGALLLTGIGERQGHEQIIEVLKAPQSPMLVYPFEEDQYRALAVYLLRERSE